MPTIHKPDANPTMLLILNLIGGLFIAGLPLGYFMIGQTMKGLKIWVMGILGVCTCGILSLIVLVLHLMDINAVGEALAAGETLDENEYRNETLHKIMSYIDSSAIYKAPGSGGTGPAA